MNTDTHPQHVEVLCGDAVRAQAPRHLLALKHASWVLAVARGAHRAVVQRVSMRGVTSAEVPPLHDSGKPLALANAAHVYQLRRNKKKNRKQNIHEARFSDMCSSGERT